MDTSKQKPDLMGTSRAVPDGAKRILAHLEHGARLPASKPARAAGWTLDGWTVGLGLLLLFMCGIAWLVHDNTITPSARKADFSGAQRYQGKQESTLAARAPTQRAQDEQIAQAGQAAAIVNEQAVQMPATAAAGAAGAVGAAGNASSPSAPMANKPGLGPATSTMAAVHVASVGAAHPKPAFATTSTTGAHPGPGAKNSASTTATAAARTPATTAPAVATRGKAAPATDTDVTLLTALVAHVNKPSVVAPERSRDIVERHDGDSTAELLSRCKQLGLIEGMLCRSRICSGRWESDATCRAPAY